MQINCRQCGAEIPADNINLDRLVAKCSECNSVFSLADQFGEADGYRTFKKFDTPLPKGIKVDNFGGELLISYRWFGPKIIFMTFFALLWNGFMVFWYGTAISNRIWIMALFGLMHAGVGVGLIYYVLAGYLNTTVVKVGMSDLEIKHGPLPYPGKRLERAFIRQLYCKERVHRNKNSTSYSYEVHAITKEGKHEKLLSGLDKSEQALYLEQEIERYLGLSDRPVRGELGR